MSFLRHPVRWTLVPFLLLSAGLAWFLDTRTPLATLPAWLVATNLLAFPVWWIDKLQARREGLRVPESTLHLVSVAGGAAGSLLAMRLLRHKTRKAAFWAIHGLLALAWLVALIWLFSPPPGQSS